MDSKRTSMAVRQNLEISARLRRLHNPERILLLRNGQIVRFIASDLEENTRVRAALVSLTRAVQEARAEAENARHILCLQNLGAHLLQYLFVFGKHRDVGKQTEIVARVNAVQMPADHR